MTAENQDQNHLGSTEKSLTSFANQQQEPKLHRVRPILFSSDMVRAILEGRKTQTRRVIGIQPLEILTPKSKTAKSLNGVTRMWDGKRTWFSLDVRGETIEGNRGSAFRCKHGEVGDRLWVRETWNVQRVGVEKAAIGYRAGGDLIRALGKNLAPTPDDPPSLGAERRWRSPIHMPYWASRITLEITGVRVERVQDITCDDCVAEGIDSEKASRHILTPENIAPWRLAYRDLWNSINEKRGYGWDTNPWVWVIEFRRISDTGEK